MAPPTFRRSGLNKKARFSVFTGYVAAAIGAMAGAILLALSLWRPQAFADLRSQALDIVSPVGEAGAEARTGTRGFFDVVSGYYRAGSKNAELRREIEIARVRLAEAKALEQENRRLRAVLTIRDSDNKPVAVARLIGATSSSSRRFAYLGAGDKQGVTPEMPVVAPKGLVGRILETGTNSSRVLLLSDSESMVPVRRAKDDLVAFAEGRADGSLRLRLINLGINPIRPGDIFVTSGAGGLFRPGIAVAVADEITKDGAIAHVLSNPAATDYVTVEPIWRPEAVNAASVPVEQELGGE
ncbi:rod shape-determining protein MreC [Altericroceibacterium endophyticum]|uniref:Cell shape-determining protein MreC n=1 Tax=Altericroceibacterium endophyticum TaxID=1808508 RepID=A0A6I4T2I1_9SPHN|nr:rod shape-determining protein MreC [Altericroceibacterium endophyticum]MXO64542.1 rod shape-determining protein MreC [Altericroceibacterium endophyticum]